MELNFNELRPYQKVCIYKMEDSIRSGKRRLFIQMPTGAGKLITLLSFFNYIKAENDVVVFLHRKKAIIDQTQELLISLNLDKFIKAQFFDGIDSLNCKEKSTYLIIDLDDFSNDLEKYYELIEKYTGIIISYFSTSSTATNNIVKTYGNLDYSLSAVDCINTDLPIVEEEISHFGNEEVYSIETKNALDFITHNEKARKLLCSLICEKKVHILNGGELLEDAVSIIAGFIPLGTIIQVGAKYICKFIKKKVLIQLRIILNCALCEEISLE